jgi:hypothetical protein
VCITYGTLAHTRVSTTSTHISLLYIYTVDTKQHQKPQHYTMNENMAYGVANTPCSTTNDRYTGQRTVDDGIHRNDVGHYHIIDGSVYEVPSVYTSATGEL